MKKYITNQHRYYSLDYYFKEKYNSKVFKVALNGNFTCPNRDGTISTKGCTFCSALGSGDFAGNKNDTLEKQFKEVKEIMTKKWPNSLYIAYFQANTNTYAPLKKLKELYEKAINLDDNIIAIDIATRPDSISDETLEYLEDLNKRKKVIIELGLQTIHQKTADAINRGYNLNIFEECVKKLRSKNIEIVVHIINGLPYETKEMMLETVKYLNTLDIQGIKIHSLYILKGSIIEKEFQENKFKILSLEEYVDIVCEQLAIIREDIVIHRINGDAPRDLLIEPKWSIKKLVVMNEIDKEMKKRNYYQGIKYQK